jgi:glyoxylate/hydroxypyruvate reductase A
MRVHIQNTASANFQVTQAQWDAACARAGESGHVVTIASTAEEGRAALRDAELLISATSMVRALFPTEAPALRTVFCTSAGLDRLVPVEDWLPDGVALLTNRGAHAAKAGEYGLMALLMLANHMPRLLTAQRDGKWDALHGSTLAGRRLVVVGLGALGGTTAGYARGHHMEVIGVRTSATPHDACDRVVTIDALDAELPGADMVFLATPLTPATRNLLDARRISLLAPQAGVVNVGRGGLLDQDALCDALDGGRLAGAVLDVFTPEPVPAGHRLWTTRNLIMTPHVSADDPNTYNDLSLDILFRNLAAARKGDSMPNRFDPARGW